jgi:glutathione S-transferase
MSDYYTHVRDIPPQYGPGFSDDNVAVKKAAEAIGGQGSSWHLPLDLRSPSTLEPLSPHVDKGMRAFRGIGYDLFASGSYP